LPALVFAAQSPYPGRQTVAYSRNVMRNKKPKIYEDAPPSMAALKETFHSFILNIILGILLSG
jgi:hypothetical protein